MQFGALLKSLRIAAGMSANDLASALGKHRNDVYRWESGPHNPRVQELRPIADILNARLPENLRVSVEQLLNAQRPVPEADEKHFLLAYQRLSADDRAYVLGLMLALAAGSARASALVAAEAQEAIERDRRIAAEQAKGRRGRAAASAE